MERIPPDDLEKVAPTAAGEGGGTDAPGGIAHEMGELHHLLVSSVQDYAIFALDPKGYILSWNAGAERIKGYAPGEIIGKHFSIFYPRELVAEGFPEFELRTAANTGRFEDEGWRLRKDGSRFWANVVITALRDDKGNLLGFAKVTRDLTERREADEALRESFQEHMKIDEGENRARREGFTPLAHPQHGVDAMASAFTGTRPIPGVTDADTPG